MTLPNQIFDIYIDLNITFAITAVVWLVVKYVLERMGVKLAYSVQLGLLNGLFVITAISPGAVALYRHLLDAGIVPGTMSVNLADAAVSQYLRGGIAISAQDFQELLGLRARLSEEILALNSALGTGVAIFFVAGVAFFGLKLCKAFIRLNQMLASCHLWREHGRLRLLLSDTAVVPFSARGLTKNYVVLPTELLTQSEDLKLVLKHEFEHLRQGDVTWEIGLEVLRPLFFWNPFFYIWKSEVERLRELACDQKVAESAQVDLRSYCMCLLRAAKSGLKKREAILNRNRSGVAAVALIEVQDRLLRRSPAQKLRSRVEALMEPNRVQPHAGFTALVVVPMAAIVFVTALAIQKPADWSQDRLMLSAIINLERLETINSFGKRPQ
ncbi:M56 family metallopeptidase [Labrenzia sp. PHM005]|uniref:M56 family metallopeptidase n=1 Tax=Labrenzia sp. PHM005 TaxID=2590016 RepID=UPI0011400415|nr:M56 family metallopeptidase [Labrenzia sp. PHM005]QDG76599.1 M56 family metallopeptidase [Labrenzia sp. PHM005]